jgi:hypothetical protein
MNFPSDKYRRRMDSGTIDSDLRALGDRSNQHLPTIDETAQGLRRHSLRRSEEGHLMKVLHSLKSHPAMAAGLGIAVVAAVLLAVPFSYTKTIGYRATLDIANTTGIDVKAVAAEFGKALDTEKVMVSAGAGGALISADLPVGSPGRARGVASGFAKALTERGVAADARVERLTERVTGNVYAMAANGIIEIRINSQGLTDEEIEDEIRAQLEAAGLEACLVDVQTDDGGKRIAIGIERNMEDGADAPTPVRISIDGMEPPADGERAMELRIRSTGKTPEEAEAEARAQLAAMGLTDVTDLDIEDCGDFYRIRVSGGADACCPGGDTGTVLGDPPSKHKTESKTLGEVKKEFTE